MKIAIVYKLKNVSAASQLSKIKYICPMTGTKARSPHGREPNVAAMNNPPPYMTVPRRVRTTPTTASEMARTFIPGQNLEIGARLRLLILLPKVYPKGQPLPCL
jgi:hypothetical protein